MPPDLTAWAKPLQAWWHAHPVGVQWPVLLWLLLAVPLLAWWLRRPRPGVRAWGATGSASDAALTAPRRLIASQGLMLGGLAALLLAASAPYVTLTIPNLRQEVMLVLDMSGSMRAADIAPDRFTAARNAAKEFVAGMPRHTRVGIVAVAGTALGVQQLTDDRQQLDKALDQLQLQRGTAIGSGIVVALAALLPDAKIDTNLHITGQPTMPGWLAGRLGAAPEEKKEPPNRQEPGANGSTAIVLVSDGMSNIGPDPLKMAQLAADHGVRLHPQGRQGLQRRLVHAGAAGGRRPEEARHRHGRRILSRRQQRRAEQGLRITQTAPAGRAARKSRNRRAPGRAGRRAGRGIRAALAGAHRPRRLICGGVRRAPRYRARPGKARIDSPAAMNVSPAPVLSPATARGRRCSQADSCAAKLPSNVNVSVVNTAKMAP